MITQLTGLNTADHCDTHLQALLRLPTDSLLMSDGASAVHLLAWLLAVTGVFMVLPLPFVLHFLPFRIP
jgi:hypothetical protein